MSKRFESNMLLASHDVSKILLVATLLIIAFSTSVFSEEGNAANSNQKAVTEFIYRRVIGYPQVTSEGNGFKSYSQKDGEFKFYEPLKENEELFTGSDLVELVSEKPVVVESRQHLLELLGAADGDLSKLSKGQQGLVGVYDVGNSPDYECFSNYADKSRYFQSTGNKISVELQDGSGIADLTFDQSENLKKALWPRANRSSKKIVIGSPSFDRISTKSGKTVLLHEVEHLTDPWGSIFDQESQTWTERCPHEYGPDNMHWAQERLGDLRDPMNRSPGSEEAGLQTAYSEGRAGWRAKRSLEGGGSEYYTLDDRLNGIVFEGDESQYTGFRPWDERITSGDLMRVEMVNAKILNGMEKIVGIDTLQKSMLNTNEGPGRITRVVENVIANNPEKTAEILGVVDQHTYQKFSPDELRALGAKGDVSQVDEYLAIRDFALSDGVSEKQSVVADADQTTTKPGAEKDQSRSLMTTPDEESSSAKVAGLAMETTPSLSKTQLGIQNVKNSLKSGFSPSNLLVTAGMAVGMNLISQTINGEKPSVEKALQSVATAEFAGSVIGGTLGAAAGTFAVPFLTGIPVVGALAPVLCAVAGSTIGAASAGELKNGNFSVSNVLKRVDWTSVAGQSVGSLAGTTAAIALVAACPVLLPVALPLTVIGGMAGGVIGDYAAHLIASLFSGASQKSKTSDASSDISSTEIPDDVGEKAVPTKVEAGLEVQNKNPLSE